MAYRPHEMSVLVAHSPKVARERLLSAFCQANANRTRAASLLGCSRQTFGAWAKKLGVDLDAAESVAKRDGWHHGRIGGANWHRNKRSTESSGIP